MRLGCPTCGARYEVAETAIPAPGREVECSSCGHRWFQHRRGAGADAAGSVGATARGAAASDGVDATGVPDGAAEATAQAARPRPTDPAVLRILREEAEREMAARRQEAARAAPAPAEAPARPPRRALLPEIDSADPPPGAETARAAARAPAPVRRGRRGFGAGMLLALALAMLAAAAYAWAGALAAAVPALEEPLARFVAAVDELRRAIRSAAGPAPHP